MMPPFSGLRVFVVMLTLGCIAVNGAAAPAAPLPATTRKVIYDKTAQGYRLAVVEAPVPRPGPGQVLVHVKFISLNRGEIENLAQPDAKRQGMIAGSDAAGEVVALGTGTHQFKVGQRV